MAIGADAAMPLTWRNAFLKTARAEPDVRWIVLLLVILYAVNYLGHPAMPGKSPYPEGWWGWWDQGNYLKSATALAGANLAASEHWYPPGYALLLAPFVRPFRDQAAFIPDLLLLLASAWLFIRVCRHFGVSSLPASLLFIGCVFGSQLLREQYVIPWTTTPAMALLLAISLVYLKAVDHGLNFRRGSILASLAVALLVTRPTDVLCLFPIFMHLGILLASAMQKRETRRDALGGIGGALLFGALLLSLSIALYLTIYGVARSPYLEASTKFGLDTGLIPRRFYMLFISPVDFFGEGEGIFGKWPLSILGVMALIFSCVFWRAYFALPWTVLAYLATYLAYPDFLPTGLWRYLNIHYLKWIFPMLGLFAVVMLRDLGRSPRRAHFAVLVVPLALLAAFQLRAVDLKPTSVHIGQNALSASFGSPVWISGARIEGAPNKFDALYFGWGDRIEVDGAVLKNIVDFRMIPVGNSIRLVLHRPVLTNNISLLFDKNAADPIAIPSDAKFALIGDAIALRRWDELGP